MKVIFNHKRAFYGRTIPDMTWGVYYFNDGDLWTFDSATRFAKFNDITRSNKPDGMHVGGTGSTLVLEAPWRKVPLEQLESLQFFGWVTWERDTMAEEDVRRSAGIKHQLASADEPMPAAVAAIPSQPLVEDPLASEIKAYPAYWRPIPAHWQAVDFYRVRALFPLPAGYESARLDHALKKLLIPGNRTGGKSVYKDLKEAHATLGQWLREHKDAFDQ